MSKYTTGEIAKLCGVSVRTVQYYDSRGILCPAELSEGGRRLYSDGDLSRLRIICFLRGIGLPINAIGQLLSESDPDSVISLLLEQQAQTLTDEIAERQRQLDTLTLLKHEIARTPDFSVESINDIATLMENRKKLRNMRILVTVLGIIADILEWGSLLLWIFLGWWQAFALCMAAAIALCVWIVRYYFARVAYICPQCHTVFRPTLREALWARHTPRTRKLHCTTCGHHGYCVETWRTEVVE